MRESWQGRVSSRLTRRCRLRRSCCCSSPLSSALFQFSINAPFIESLTSDTTGAANHRAGAAYAARLDAHAGVGTALFRRRLRAATCSACCPASIWSITRPITRRCCSRGAGHAGLYVLQSTGKLVGRQDRRAGLSARGRAAFGADRHRSRNCEADPDAAGADVVETAHRIDCMHDKIILRVAWHAERQPQRDLSVFVHLLDAQRHDDRPGRPQRAGLRLATADELGAGGSRARRVHACRACRTPRRSRYGLYEQRADGSFNNVIAYTLPVECG